MQAAGWARVKERDVGGALRGVRTACLPCTRCAQGQTAISDGGRGAGEGSDDRMPLALRVAPGPATNGQDASKSKVVGRGGMPPRPERPTRQAHLLLVGVLRPGAAIVTMSSIRRGARQPAGTDFRCGGTFSHRSECRIGIRHQILFYLNTLLPRDRVRAEPAFGRFSCAQPAPCVLLVTLLTAIWLPAGLSAGTAICPSGACGLRDGGGPSRAGGDPKCKMRQFAYTACAAGYGRGSAEIIFENE